MSPAAAAVLHALPPDVTSVYLVVPEGSERPEFSASTGAVSGVFHSLDAIDLDGGLEPGVILVDPAVSGGAEILNLALRVARSSSDWHLAVADPDDPGAYRSISVGPLFADDPEGGDVAGGVTIEERLASMRWVLGRISESRHLLNNHLASALAETQLLHMDAPDQLVASACERIEAELRVMRREIASHLSFASSARWS